MTTVYDALRSDHRKLEKLMDQLVDTAGDSEDRNHLFDEFSDLFERHSHAEERAFYAVLLEDKDARGKTAHGIKEHCEAASLLDELKELDRSNSGWLPKMKSLREEVRHHIEEEEGDLFAKAKKVVPKSDEQTLAETFDTYKAQE